MSIAISERNSITESFERISEIAQQIEDSQIIPKIVNLTDDADIYLQDQLIPLTDEIAIELLPTITANIENIENLIFDAHNIIDILFDWIVVIQIMIISIICAMTVVTLYFTFHCLIQCQKSIITEKPIIKVIDTKPIAKSDANATNSLSSRPIPKPKRIMTK